MGSNESAYTIPGSLRRTWTNAGIPTNGAAGTYYGVADKGDLLIDTTNATLYQNTNTKASPTWTQKAASGVAIDTVVGNMAAAGTAAANALGAGVLAAPISHVHALGTHTHSSATTGGSVSMGVVGSMAAAGTAAANAAGTGTLPAAIDHAHALGTHDHSGATTGSTLALAALAADFFTADATGRGKFQTGIFDAATLTDLVAANALTNANCDSFFVASAFAADADSRGKFADGIWTAAKMAAGLLSADATGRALIAAGFFDAATALSAFADNSIPGSKVNWSYGVTASTITPDDSASAGVAATVSRSDHVHANTCAAPADGSLAAANAEGAAVSFSRSDHAHRAVVLDSVEIEIGTSYDAVIGWEIGDADNHTLVIGLADGNQALHIADKSAIATNWDVVADTHPSLYIHSDTTPATDYLKLYHDATSGYVNAAAGSLALQVDAVTEILAAATGVTINEASNDRDFRVESNGLQYALYVDGAKDCVVIGDDTDVSDIDVRLRVGNVAKTLAANESAAIVWVAPTAATTTSAGAGVHGIIATQYLAEPNLTAGVGTITVAATLYIANAPTEGVTNAALYVAAGAATFLGTTSVLADNVNLAIGASSDVIARWSTADDDNHAFAIGLGASLAMHICQAADIATDWNVAADANPALYIHGATTPATEYLKLYTDETNTHIDSVGAILSFDIAGTNEMTLTTNALNLVDSTLYGSAASGGDLILASTTHGTEGCVTIPTGHLGLKVGGTADRAGTAVTNVLAIFDGTPPDNAQLLANGIELFSAAGECKVADAAGNQSTLSPHTPDGDYIIHSTSGAKNRTITIHLEKLVKALINKDPSLAKFVEDFDGYEPTPLYKEKKAKGQI